MHSCKHHNSDQLNRIYLAEASQIQAGFDDIQHTARWLKSCIQEQRLETKTIQTQLSPAEYELLKSSANLMLIWMLKALHRVS